MGGIHKCAVAILAGKASMVAVRVVDVAAVSGKDHGTIYSSCPSQFFASDGMSAGAEHWCDKLNQADTWPNGNPGYRIVEIDGSESVDVLTGETI